MQLQDMIIQVRDEIGEESVPSQLGTQSGTWSDSQITSYLNIAQGLLAEPARIQAPPYTINLTVGTYQYAIPSDSLEDGIRKVTWSTGGIGYDVSASSFDRVIRDIDYYVQNQQFYTPTLGAIYAFWAGQIYLYPIPQTQGDTLTIYYYKRPTDLVNLTDVSQISIRFHKALVKYAVAECQAAAEESQLQMLAMQEYQRLAMQLTMERAKETRDRPARVRVRR